MEYDVGDFSNLDVAVAAVADPATSAAELAQIAAAHPSLGPQVAAHVNVYPGLLDWLGQHGDQATRAAVAARFAPQVAAPVLPPADVAPDVDRTSDADDASVAGMTVARRSVMPGPAAPVPESVMSAVPDGIVGQTVARSSLPSAVRVAGAGSQAAGGMSASSEPVADMPVVVVGIAPGTEPLPAIPGTPNEAAPAATTSWPSLVSPAGAPPGGAVVDAPAPGFAVLGFFIPVVGLILWLIWKDATPLKARSVGKGALISVIVGAAVTVLSYIVLFAMLGALT
jgi:hypothetical protein